MDAEPIAGLDSLPSDLLARLLSLCFQAERCRCLAVCQRWRKALSSPLCWSSLDFRGCAAASRDDILAACGRAQAQLCVLEVDALGPQDASRLYTSNPSLRSLSIGEASGASATEEDASSVLAEAGLDACELRVSAPCWWTAQEAAAVGGLRGLRAPLCAPSLAAAAPFLAQGSVSALKLERARIDNDGASAVARALVDCSALPTALLVSFNDIGDAGARSLAAALPRLHTLRLACNGVGAEGAKHLAEALQRPDCRTRTLDLTRCPVGGDGAAALAAALRCGARLRTLELGSCGVGPRGASSLAAALPRCSLARLELHSNGIGDAGAAALAAALAGGAHATGLASLGLAFNAITRVGAKALAPALRRRSRLAHLDIGRNALGEDGCREVLCALRGSPSLVALRANCVAGGAEAARRFGGLLRSCPRLADLDVSGNALTGAGVARLARGLADSVGSARVLRLSRADADDSAAHALALALRSPGGARLALLDVSNNAIGCDGARALAAACRTPHGRARLRVLDLRGWFLPRGDRGAEELRAAETAAGGTLSVLLEGAPDDA